MSEYADRVCVHLQSDVGKGRQCVGKGRQYHSAHYCD